jgi:hypothetical protein
MSIATPAWLQQRDGRLEGSQDGQSWLVYLASQPQYLLMPTPARGKFSCRISQTNNGRRLDQPAVYDSVEQAVAGGLEQLRQVLGW